MAENLPNQLTSKARVKSRIGITVADHDDVIDRMINGVSSMIESYCNRSFKRATISNEVHSINARGMDMLMLKQAPVISLTSVQYRAGSPGTPAWTSYGADDVEISGDGSSGLVRMYGSFPYGTNTVRASYVAGYLIDFTDIDDPVKHTLPADLSEICEQIVVKYFKRREHEGKLTESFNGGSIAYDREMTPDQKMVLDRYRRVPAFL